jgi:DNA-binding transcriptional MerR regulator
LGVSIQTLHRLEKQGALLPDRKSKGTRYYSTGELCGLKNSSSDLKIAYEHVSSHDQEKDSNLSQVFLLPFAFQKAVLKKNKIFIADR